MKIRQVAPWRVLALVLLAVVVCSAANDDHASREQLYVELRALAERHRTPFEVPTAVLVGHHNDGASALLEALVGLRIAHVGASMATRRPLRVEMAYDAGHAEPALFLEQRDGEYRPVSAAELRAHVEAENARLADLGAYEAAEIRVRLLSRRASSLVLVDTPGLLSDAAPATGAGADAAVRHAADAAMAIVRAQIEPKSRLILCLEDTSDWQVSPTRRAVQAVDADLSRTVVVATKLDGKLAQFTMREDLHRLMGGAELAAAAPKLRGGPLFTSVPSSTREAADFLGAVGEQEKALCKHLAEQIGSDEYSARVGVGAVRAAVEAYGRAEWDGLAARATRAVDARSARIDRALRSPPRAAVAGGAASFDASPSSLAAFADRFGAKVHTLIRGCVRAGIIETFGETIDDERRASRSGDLCLLCAPFDELEMRAAERATPMELSEEMAAEAAEAEVAAAVGDGGISEYLKTNKRLFGGAQYWRALQEFSIGATQGWSSRERRIVDGELSDEEILNAMGFDGIHDGVNYMRAVCVTAIERGAGYFEPQLASLKTRLLHIMRRLPPLVEELLVAEEEAKLSKFGAQAAALAVDDGPEPGGSADGRAASRATIHALVTLATPLYLRFVDEMMEATMAKCLNDIEAITKCATSPSPAAPPRPRPTCPPGPRLPPFRPHGSPIIRAAFPRRAEKKPVPHRTTRAF